MPFSHVARLQQLLVAALVAGAAAWAAAWWPRHPGVAIAGALAILLIHAVVLAVEFALLRPASKADPAPKPRVRDLVTAWAREVVQNVRVFAWRQPFTWRRCPDRLQGAAGAIGIVFVHGFVCNRGFWAPWLQEADRRGHPCLALNLEPPFGSIDAYAPLIDEAVQRMTAATGRPPLLVCHSMGGLAARAWSRSAAGPMSVSHIVTIASPHHGTWLARFGRSANGRQMRMDGEWLRTLRAEERLDPGRFTCWYSNCDNVVFPPTTATLRGADNRLLAGAAHVDLAFRPEVLAHTFALARSLCPDHRPSR